MKVLVVNDLKWFLEIIEAGYLKINWFLKLNLSSIVPDLFYTHFLENPYRPWLKPLLREVLTFTGRKFFSEIVMSAHREGLYLPS